MARPTLFRHRKFIALCVALGEAQALGHLEWLWNAQYEVGDALIGTSDVVEHQARWRGEPGVLTDILLRLGFIEETPDGYSVHDFWHHAPSYVARRHQRETERRATGKTVSDIRSAAGKKGAEKRWHDDDEWQMDGKRMTSAKQLIATPSTQHPIINTATQCLSARVPTPMQLLDVWNQERGVLPSVKALSPKRTAAAKSRLHDVPDLDRWRAAIRRIAASSFCRGDGKTGWIANFDWLIRPDTLLRIEEGRYDDRKVNGAPSKSEADLDAEERRAMAQMRAIAGAAK